MHLRSLVAQSSFMLRMTLNYKHSSSTSPGPGGDGIQASVMPNKHITNRTTSSTSPMCFYFPFLNIIIVAYSLSKHILKFGTQQPKFD